MIFNSINFFVFFISLGLIYYLVPNKMRNYLLLAGNIYFYMSFGHGFILYLLISALSTYFGAILIEKNKHKKLVLASTIILNLCILMIFKYLNFFTSIFLTPYDTLIYGVSKNYFSLMIPIGISFYTFQSLGYIIDIYKNKYKAEKNFIIYSLFISFFPQILSGPISRGDVLIPQFYKERSFDYDNLTTGIKFIALGFFKKVVIADKVGMIVDKVYSSPEAFNGSTLLITAILYSVQIYTDFSGYSDMAYGFAKMLGFDLPFNFRVPYLSKTIGEFWKRWHISLSSWLRDYVYFSLGGSRKKPFRAKMNVMITFLVSGIWHGASFTFIIWGLIHGLAIAIENTFKIKFNKNKLSNILGIFYVFTLTTFAWIFFRASGMNDAFIIISKIFTDFSFSGITLPGTNTKDLFIMFASMAALIFIDFNNKENDFFDRLKNKNVYLRWAFYYIFIIWILFFGEFGSERFIYFQF